MMSDGEAEALRSVQAHANPNASLTIPLREIPGGIPSGLYTSGLFTRKRGEDHGNTCSAE